MSATTAFSHSGDGLGSTRPPVSVCIAAYNGELFAKEQIYSILQQLSREDEIVIIDDASTDKTRDVILSFNDERIRLLTHKYNVGVLASFEDAIRISRGEIIFLSDQDDIWAPDKVRIVLEAFSMDPGVTLVASDAKVIGHDGTEVLPSYYAHRGVFSSGVINNLWRCKYLGCTMAFRSSKLPHILPFPRQFSALRNCHDIWIGMRNSLSGGKTLYIDRPLVLYRRHGGNVSRKMRLFSQMKVRIYLLLALLSYRSFRRIGWNDLTGKTYD